MQNMHKKMIDYCNKERIDAAKGCRMMGNDEDG